VLDRAQTELILGRCGGQLVDAAEPEPLRQVIKLHSGLAEPLHFLLDQLTPGSDRLLQLESVKPLPHLGA
jgi:hypothetical protein